MNAQPHHVIVAGKTVIASQLDVRIKTRENQGKQAIPAVGTFVCSTLRLNQRTGMDVIALSQSITPPCD